MLRHLLRIMAAAPSPKRLKTSFPSTKPDSTGPLIATHNGHFHADEALAVYLLRLLPNYTPSRLLRTRDPSLLSTAHTVVDVGGEYDATTNRYDHHQRTFGSTFPSRSTKLSSAGLVYLHFGKAIIALRTGLPENDPRVDIMWRKLYVDFVEALDAHDNGISVYDPAETKGLKKRFHDGGVGLGSLVGDLNDGSSEDEEDEQEGEVGGMDEAQRAQRTEDERFLRASKLMGKTFLRKLRYLHRSWLPARASVHEAYDRRKEFEKGGRVIVFDKPCPWKDHLYTLEEERAGEPRALYVLYPESELESAKWRVQAVGASRDSFESRKALPAPWRGVRDQELDDLTGIMGCVFVHASGFIGGNATKEGALAMARRAIEE